MTGAHHRRDLGGRAGQHDRRWGHGVLQQPVGFVGGELPLVCDDVLGADDAPQPFDQGAIGHFTTIQSSTAVDCR